MKRWFCYFLLLFFILYTTKLYNSPAGVFLTGVVFLLPFFLILILFTHVAGVSVTLSMIETMTENCKSLQGNDVSISLIILNSSPFPITRVSVRIWLTNKGTGEVKKITAQEAVEAGKELYIVQEIPELGAGLWDINLKKIMLYDLAGFLHLDKRGKQQEELVILPRLFEANVMVTGRYTAFSGRNYPKEFSPRETERYHFEQGGDDMSHIQDFREYKPGDKIRNIHWKISVKKDEVMVKIPEKSIDSAINFLVEAPECWERQLEIVYAISHALCMQGCCFGLIWTSKKEQEVTQIKVFSEEELYLAIEEFIRHGITDKIRLCTELEGNHIRLDKELRLIHNNDLMIELEKGDLQEKLLEMELII